MTPDLESLGSIAGAIAAVALVLAAAHAVGRLVVSATPCKASGFADTQILRIVIGLNLVGMIGVALGALRLLTGSQSIGLLATLALLPVIFTWRRWSGSGASATCAFLARPRFPWLCVPAVVLAFVTLGPALCYPTGWDELVYHHVLPRRWLADGWPAFYADLPYSGFPSLGEILFWLMAPIESIIAPRLMSWLCWIIGLVFLYRLLRRILAISSAITLTIAFASSSTVLLISANCYVETILLMNFAALLLVLSQRPAWAAADRAVGNALCGVPPADRRKAVILGVLAGGAAAVKLTGLAILVVPCLWYAGQAWPDRSRLRPIVQSLTISLVVALFVCLPFYLRPWLLTGNPFYPYYGQWFTIDPARLEMSRYHHALGAAFGVHSPAAFVLGPFLLAFDYEIYDGDFGWQLLIFIALAALAGASFRRKQRRPFVLWPAAVFGSMYVFWYLTAQQARFAIPAILALALLAATGLRQLHGTQRKLVLVALLAAALLSAPWRTTGHYLGSWLTVLRLVSRTDYVNVSTDRDYLPLVQSVAEHTPPNAKLMLLFEHRGFYLPRSYIIGTPFFQEAGFTPPEQFADATRVMDVLAGNQITHVILTSKPTGPDQPQEWLDRLDPFFASFQQCVEQEKLRPIWRSERYLLFELTKPIAPAPSGSP